jgi:hypothetical protein
MFLKKVHIHTGKEQKVFKRVANQVVDVGHSVRISLDYLVELLAEKTYHVDCRCEENYVHRVVVSNICEVVGLLLGC